MSSYLWPMTSPPSVLARYRLVMFGPCMCFIFMYIWNLPTTHTSAVTWKLVCTSCRPSLASDGVIHFLASNSLKLALFWGWAFAWPWAFPPSTHFLALFCSLCVSYRTALSFMLWCYLTQACWASLDLLLILPSMTQYSHLGFLVTLGILGPFTFIGPFSYLSIPMGFY